MSPPQPGATAGNPSAIVGAVSGVAAQPNVPPALTAPLPGMGAPASGVGATFGPASLPLSAQVTDFSNFSYTLAAASGTDPAAFAAAIRQIPLGPAARAESFAPGLPQWLRAFLSGTKSAADPAKRPVLAPFVPAPRLPGDDSNGFVLPALAAAPSTELLKIFAALLAALSLTAPQLPGLRLSSRRVRRPGAPGFLLDHPG